MSTSLFLLQNPLMLLLPLEIWQHDRSASMSHESMIQDQNQHFLHCTQKEDYVPSGLRGPNAIPGDSQHEA